MVSQRLLDALTVIAIVGTTARWTCWKAINIRPETGCDRFQIEISAPGYWARCDFDLRIVWITPNVTRERAPVSNCVGDPFGTLSDALIGAPQALEIPCTTWWTNVRVSCPDSVVYDGPVTSGCDSKGACVYKR